jgi:hypothetical protein
MTEFQEEKDHRNLVRGDLRRTWERIANQATEERKWIAQIACEIAIHSVKGLCLGHYELWNVRERKLVEQIVEE